MQSGTDISWLVASPVTIILHIFQINLSPLTILPLRVWRSKDIRERSTARPGTGPTTSCQSSPRRPDLSPFVSASGHPEKYKLSF